MENKYLKIDWNTLFAGLKNNWISSKQTVRLINENQSLLNCNDDLLVDLNVNDDDKNTILDLIQQNYEVNEEQGIKEWQNSILFTIKNSQLSIEEKLVEIANRWAYFDYLDEWRGFIHYSSGGNVKANSSEEIYKNFLNYLKQLEIK